MKEYKTEQIRNFSIIGGANVGKTSIGDVMMFNAGLVTRIGKTDDGSSNLDFGSDEVQRKITTQTSLFNVETTNALLTFLDTPGYPGFNSHIITATAMCETSLIVVCAENGIDVQTRKSYKQAYKSGQSRVMVFNRMDKERVDFDELLDQMSGLSKHIHPLWLPIGAGESFKGVVDLVRQKAYIDSAAGVTEQDIPAELADMANELRNRLIEAVAETNEDLLNKYLETGELSQADLESGLCVGVMANDIIPAVFTSSVKNIGMRHLAATLAAVAPSPDKKAFHTWISGNGDETKSPVMMNSGTTAIIFKIMDDPKLGEYFFLKSLQGTVKNGVELMDTTSNNKERIGHLYLFNGKNREEVPTLVPGQIGCTAKLKSAVIGTLLTDDKSGRRMKPFQFPTPIIAEAIVTDNEKDREKLGEGVNTQRRLDPCFLSENRPEFSQMIIFGLSKLQLDVMLDRIKAKYNIQVRTEAPQIPYRETIQSTAKAQGKYKKQSGGHGQYGDCWLELKPRELGAGYNFIDSVVGGVIPNKFIPAVDKGVQDAMSKGILAGYPVVDVEAICYDGSSHSVDSSDMAFQMAGILAFRRAAESAQPVLLEPVMEVTITVPDEAVGDVSADFNSRRGKIISMDAADENGYKTIKAFVPLAELHEYTIDLNSMTRGDSEYCEKFVRYEVVPTQITKKIVEQRAHLKAKDVD